MRHTGKANWANDSGYCDLGSQSRLMNAHMGGRATPDTPIPSYWPLILAWTVSLSFQPWASFSPGLCSDRIWTEAILIKKHLDVHELCPKSPACTYCCRSPSRPGTRPSRRCPCPRCIENIGLEDEKKILHSIFLRTQTFRAFLEHFGIYTASEDTCFIHLRKMRTHPVWMI